jgi:hypothetical protein
MSLNRKKYNTRSSQKFPEVPRSSQKFPEVPRSSRMKNITIVRGNEKGFGINIMQSNDYSQLKDDCYDDCMNKCTAINKISCECTINCKNPLGFAYWLHCGRAENINECTDPDSHIFRRFFLGGPFEQN